MLSAAVLSAWLDWLVSLAAVCTFPMIVATCFDASDTSAILRVISEITEFCSSAAPAAPLED